MHKKIEPEILYFGTPVVLISTCNEDNSFNIAPISSIFWLGWRCIIGISAFSKTTENILRNKTCVLNLPSKNEVSAVNKLALTTGSFPVPPGKKQKGYTHVRDKFGLSGMHALPSETIADPRIKECPVQMEAILEHCKDLGENETDIRGKIKIIELRIQRVHAEESIMMDHSPRRIDPDKWKPLIMSFQKFYTLNEQLQNSRLAKVSESLYHSPDLDRGRTAAVIRNS